METWRRQHEMSPVSAKCEGNVWIQCACVFVFVRSVRREMEEEVGQMQQTIQDMERSCDPLYAPCDPDPAHSPVCRNLTRKQGYLYIRK